MNSPLQHDPRTKQQIVEALYEYLYGPVRQLQNDKLIRLITRNTLLIQASHNSFKYKGILYNADSERPPLKSNKLLPQLVPEMEEYLRETKQLNEEEMPRVLGYIRSVLNTPGGLADYMHLLPESIHHPIEKMVATCPCKSVHLSQDAIEEFRNKNQASIELIKKRLLTNLLI